MDFHIGAELLWGWFHFRLTLPHIYWVSDCFWIQTGRDGTITWVGEHCSDTPEICNTVLLNSQVSNSFEHYSLYGLRISLPTSHWANKNPFNSVPVSWDCLRGRSGRGEIKTPPASSPLLQQALLYHCLEIHSGIHQGLGDLSRLLKVNVICRERKGTQSI